MDILNGDDAHGALSVVSLTFSALDELLEVRTLDGNICETLESILEDRLTNPSSEIVDALQRVLFVSHGLDVTRAEISRFFHGLFYQGAETHTVSLAAAIPSPAPAPSPQAAKTIESHAQVQAGKTIESSQQVPAPAHLEEPVFSAQHAFGHSLEFLLEHPTQYLTGHKPCALRTPDGRVVPCRAWGQVVVEAVSWFAAHHPRPTLPFRARAKSTMFLLNTAPHHPHRPMINPTEISWDGVSVFLEKNISARDIIRALHWFIETIDPKLDFRVFYDQEPAAGPAANLASAIAEELRLHGAPAHYTRIAELMRARDPWKEVTDQTISVTIGGAKHLFARVGPGTYGLVEWGLRDQRVERPGHGVADLIVTFLEAKGFPADKNEIIGYVRERILCKDQSVAQRLLKDDRFQRHGKDKYGLSKWTF